jgi:MFS family permease
LLSILPDNYNRKTLLSAVVIAGGLSQAVTGYIQSFPLLCFMRAFHGACFSMTIPLLATMVRDYFPKDKRGTANSLLYSANYFGTALSSMGILLISSFGWKATYGIMGAAGVAVGILTNLIARDKKFENKKKELESGQP